MSTQTILKSAFGAVLIPERNVSALRENASGWLGLAELHFGLAQAETADGDLDKAIEHTRYIASKLETALRVLVEARDLKSAQELQAMELGS